MNTILLGMTILGIWLSINVIESNLLSKVIMLILFYLLGSIFILYLDLYFLGLTYIIIYCGAIAILFLFVLMISPNIIIKDSTTGPKLAYGPRLAFIFLILGPLAHINGGAEGLYQLTYNSWLCLWPVTDLTNITLILFNGYPLYFLIIGLFLWILLLGILTII